MRYIENFDWDDRLLIIIMEYVPGGDLGKFIADEGVLAEDMTKAMSRQLLSALGYLHTNNITHRDVKPDNILINSLEPLELKLTDFGLSKMVDSEQTFLRTFCGTCSTALLRYTMSMPSTMTMVFGVGARESVVCRDRGITTPSTYGP